MLGNESCVCDARWKGNLLRLNPIQVRADALFAQPHITTLLCRGGTGSGKTVYTCSAVLKRGLQFPKTRHVIFRATAVEARTMLFNATFRETLDMMLTTSDGSSTWDFFDSKNLITREPMCVKLPNGSEIHFGGLDDNASLNKILGADYATALISEAQNIDSYRVVQRVKGRLRQKAQDADGVALIPKLIMDCNPPSKRHWTYQVFVEKLHPIKKTPLKNPDSYAEIKMNAEHNVENLSAGYLDGMDYDANEHQQMLLGEWFDQIDNPLFYADDIANQRQRARSPDDCDDLTAIVVAVDPAVTSKEGSDETGIVVVGADEDGHGYVLEDLSGVYTPYQWASVAASAFDRWKANHVVAEKNQGGDMVELTLRTANSSIPVKLIHASRGKEIRAESTSTAYRQKRIHHCGEFAVLEKQLLEFETGFDRRRKGSPDRLDALVHGFNDILFSNQNKGRVRVEINPRFWG